MESEKDNNHKSGFFGNIAKRIGKKHSHKNLPEPEAESEASVILHGTIMSIPCRNVLALAKWIDLDIKLKEVDSMVKKEHKTEAYLKMNPAGTMPTLEDDGFYIWESRAILIYLLRKYGVNHAELYPYDHQKQALVDNMLFFDSSSIAPSLGDYFYPQIMLGESPNVEKEAVMRDRLSVLNTILEKQLYVTGNQITLADLTILGGCSLLEICDYNIDSYPYIEQWRVRAAREIPHYEETTAKGVGAVKQFYKSRQK
ncbi:Glutathione S-Transferase [Chamberlinius hualienensis]